MESKAGASDSLAAVQGDFSQAVNGELTFLDALIAMARYKRLVVGVPIFATLIAALVSVFLPNRYIATVRILPPQQSQSNAVAILGQLGALTGGVSQTLGLKNPSDIFVAMLKSRSVADNVIAKFELTKIYDEEFLSDARKELRSNTDIATAREGVITIDFEDSDAKRAAEIANFYITELERLTLNLAVSEAAQRRLFFERQLLKAKQDLANAEVEMQRLQERTGVVNPSGQASLSVAAAAGLRAQITAKEIELATLRSFATDENPDLIRVEKQLEGLRSQLGKTSRASDEKGDVLLGIGKVPGASIEFIKRFREVKYYETLFELLARQYEIARIDEAKNATLIQVLDRAVPPERKSYPQRTLIVIITFALSLFLSILFAFLLDARDRAILDPLRTHRVALLRRYLAWR